ncbi:DUF3613 domain-containing protein [Thioalkalivibrio sp. ALE28]|uniref:DUF3613 domain-containing protein n=1 Tax=Thioalkalivibrio sp. ALE28 TaxID=1158179 RepID=UPI0003638ED1|nr:DUF3613 domain-containing protein [Thioalkalivibrio sp. ALE28]
MNTRGLEFRVSAAAVVAVLTGFLLGISGVVRADGSEEVRPVTEPVGEATRDWLQVQRGGEQASPTTQGLPEAARTRALGRYLESFEHPIPETYFPRDSFGTR